MTIKCARPRESKSRCEVPEFEPFSASCFHLAFNVFMRRAGAEREKFDNLNETTACSAIFTHKFYIISGEYACNTNLSYNKVCS